MGLTIVPAQSGGDLDEVRVLLRDYAASIQIDLAFQGFEAEMATLPGPYVAPRGILLLARDVVWQGAGCIAVRPLVRPHACEIKRLYVRPSARGTGAGRALVERGVTFAASAGYREILLDTLPGMAAAIGLYRALGFDETAPYGSNPAPGMLYFRKTLELG